MADPVDHQPEGSGWPPAAPASSVGEAASGRAIHASRASDAVEVVRHEEELRVRTVQREAGRARITTRIETEPIDLAVALGHEELRVHRAPIDPETDPAVAPAALSEDEYDVVLYDEEYAVVRRIVPVERVHVQTVAVQETRQVSATVRSEQVEVRRTGDGAG